MLERTLKSPLSFVGHCEDRMVGRNGARSGEVPSSCELTGRAS